MKISLRILLTLFILSLLNTSSFAQKKNKDDDEPRYLVFTYGGFAGMYFASNATAMFYNGSNANDNSIEEYFEQHPRAWEEVGYAMNRPVDIGELPSAMKYNPGYNIGFHGSVFIKENQTITLGIGFCRLKASDVFRLDYLNTADDHLTDDTYYLAKIEGEEKRYQFDVGYQVFFREREKSRWFFEAGFSLNNVEVNTHMIQIEDLVYNIKSDYTSSNYYPDNNAPVYNIRQGKIGFGGFGAIGIEYRFNETLTLEPVLKAYYAQNNIPGYSDLYLHFVPALRVTFKAMLEFIDEE